MASKLDPGPATSQESALRSGSPQSGAGGLAVPVESRAGLTSGLRTRLESRGSDRGQTGLGWDTVHGVGQLILVMSQK